MPVSSCALQPARLRTLLVDDEESFGENLVKLLGERGFEAEFVPTAEDAVGRSEGSDLIVVDLSLPGMSGKELAETIQRRHPAKWIVLLTARKVLKREIERSGSVKYIALFDKPLVGPRLEEFCQKLAELQEMKDATIGLLNDALMDLAVARDPRRDLLDRIQAFASAKSLVRGQIQDAFRARSSERRQIAMMLRVAIDRLSLVASDEFRLREPGPAEFDVLMNVLLTLGVDHLSADAEMKADRAFEGVGLGVRIDVPDPSVFFDD